MANEFLTAFMTLFVIVDPIGTAAVFMGLTATAPADTRERIALRATLTAIGVLALFAVAGDRLLALIGISIPAFRLTGGLLLFATAYRMVFTGQSAESEAKSESAVHNLAVFPLSIPLLAGPGCITATILISQKAETSHPLGQALMAILAVEFLALACMLMASALARLLGQSTLHLLARLFGILLAALAVQFVADGTRQMFGL